MVESEKPVTPIPPAIVRPSTSAPTREGKTKTINLAGILSNTSAPEIPTEKKIEQPSEHKTVTLAQLQVVWNRYAEQRKDQVAEYHLLQQPYQFVDNLITIQLTNPVEEPLLQSIKSSLIEFLRTELGNSYLQVTGTLQAVESRKIAYTNKEKFDLMAEQNPILIDLKNRFGLDPDF